MMYRYLKKSFALLVIGTLLITSNVSKAITVVNKLDKPVVFRIVCTKTSGDSAPALVQPEGKLSACGDSQAQVDIGRDWGKDDPKTWGPWKNLANSAMKHPSVFLDKAYADRGNSSVTVPLEGNEEFYLQRVNPQWDTDVLTDDKTWNFIKRVRNWSRS